MRMRYINVAGTDTRCILAGHDKLPPIIMLHGLALSSEVWLKNIDALADRHHVVAVDMLGHAFTKPQTGTALDIPAKLAHLRALVDTLELESFALCGSSYGALISMLFYLANKHRVNRLVISGSGSCFNTDDQLVDQLNKLYELYRPSLTSGTREDWAERIGKAFYNQSKLPPELPLVASHIYAQPWAEQRWLETIKPMLDLESFRPFRVLDRLEEIDLPTLIVWGREDKGGLLASAEEGIKRMPRAHLAVFDECGHYPMIEHPEKFNTLVGDFLQS